MVALSPHSEQLTDAHWPHRHKLRQLQSIDTWYSIVIRSYWKCLMKQLHQFDNNNLSEHFFFLNMLIRKNLDLRKLIKKNKRSFGLKKLYRFKSWLAECFGSRKANKTENNWIVERKLKWQVHWLEKPLRDWMRFVAGSWLYICTTSFRFWLALGMRWTNESAIFHHIGCDNRLLTHFTFCALSFFSPHIFTLCRDRSISMDCDTEHTQCYTFFL